MQVSLIVAVAKNNVIGDKNQLIWRLSDDLKNFKALTTDNAVIMGRKTYDSIGKALPNRMNIVLSRNEDLIIDDCMVVNSLEEAIAYAKENSVEEAFIIGGQEVYKQAFKYVKKAYVTYVDASPDGDAYFSKEKLSNWEEVSRKKIEANDKNEYDFEIVELLKPV